MKAVQVIAPGKAKLVDVAKPEWRPGHAIIRPEKLSLCGSDIRMLYHAAPSEYPFPPGTTGHEMVGTVEQVDSAETDLRPGDRTLTLAPGHKAMCEFYLAPLEHIVPLPEGPLEVLLQAQQLGTIIYAAKRLPNVVGKDVAIIGQGSAGLWFNFQLRRMGARKVIGIDLEEYRLKKAAPFGATHVIQNGPQKPLDEIQSICDQEGVDIVIEAAGEIDAINLAIELVKQNGDILFFGYPRGQFINFNFELFFHKCCRATTIVGSSQDANQDSTRTAVDIIGRGEVDASEMITHRIPFADVLDSYEIHRTRADDAIKIVIEMPR